MASPRCTAPRGVYRLPFLSDTGHRLIVAVTRHGHALGGPVRVFEGEDLDAAADRLRAVLDELDPLGDCA